MRIKQMIIHNNLSEMKNRILPTCLRGNYRNSLGEFSNTSCGVFGAERVKYTFLCNYSSQTMDTYQCRAEITRKCQMKNYSFLKILNNIVTKLPT